MKNVIVLSSLVLLLLTGCSQPSNTATSSPDTSKKPIIYKISAGVPDSHFEVAALKELEKHVESKTNGEIDIQIFPNNQLGDDKEALELIQQGVVQMVPTGTSALSNFEKSFSILSSPYLFKSQDDINNLLGGEWGKDLLATMDNSGFIGLGFGTLGFTNMSNNIRPIVTADDIKDLKIRCVQNPLLLDFYKEVGAKPVSMSFNELFAALQQGVVDGQFNPFTTIVSSNLNEVQKYVSKTKDIASLVVFTVNKAAFNDLTSDQQQAINEGVDLAIDYMSESLDKEEAEAEKQLIESGTITINEVSDETKTELFNRGYSVIEKYGNEVNAELFNKLKKELGL